MFENIIGQQGAVETLRRQLTEGSFPGAVLLHGPPYAGKLSAALEIARVLTCLKQGEWSCSCPSCRRQRLLVHPATLMAGARYFEADIAAAAGCLRRARTTQGRYLFVRAVRKLTRRFDPPLWEGEESRLRPLAGTLAQVEEALDALSPEEPGSGEAEGGKPEGGKPEGRELAAGEPERRLDALLSACRQLARSLPQANIPIQLVRRAAAWLHLTSPGPGARRVLILENAEGMLEASSNSLLKLLEEPPPDAFIVLTTTRRAALAPTVLSRLRPYPFAERSRAETAEVLARIFREEAPTWDSLREYFLHWREVDSGRIGSFARSFVEALVSAGDGSEGEILEGLAGLFAGKEAREAASIFYEELLARFGELLRAGAASPRRLARWNAVLGAHREACERYNQSPLLNLESLFLSLRGSS
jgi:DNA polymerase-3 subunit delta'